MYRGCAHHTSCAPASAGDISPSAQGLFMEVSPVSWPWWGFVPQQNPPGCCGAVSLLIPSLSFLHSLSHPKCHKPDGPGDTELYSASGLSVPWSWASSTSTAPTGSRSWGTEPRLAGRRGMPGDEHCWGLPRAGRWFPGFSHQPITTSCLAGSCGDLPGASPWKWPLVACVCLFGPSAELGSSTGRALPAPVCDRSTASRLAAGAASGSSPGADLAPCLSSHADLEPSLWQRAMAGSAGCVAVVPAV